MRLNQSYDWEHIPTVLIVNRLPHIPRPRMSVCILADAADIDRAKQIELEYMSVDDLKKYMCPPFVTADKIIHLNTQAQQEQEAR